MTERELHNLAAGIRPLAPTDLEAAQARLDDLTKPPGSLGRLEEVAKRLAAIQRTTRPRIGRKRVYTLAADHGVTEEGVSAYPREVTAQMVLNFLRGGAAINVLARHAGAEIVVVDVGVDHDFHGVQGLVHAKVARGTRNLARGPAMTRAQALQALGVGVDLARQAARDRVDLVGIGEMGIGNTTPASAILAAFTGLPPAEVVGRGTGVDDEGLRRKAEVVGRALEVNRPDPSDPLDVLHKVGGFEIAGMAGVCLGAAALGLPVVVDGFISTAAALVACRLAPRAAEYLFLSHLSQERAHIRMVEHLGQEPLLVLELRLGEGTGAALAMPVIEAAARILSEMATFSEAGVSNREDSP
ncbi:nicotinate-nucleotide--dimethylbenzimidazole phosphoribosyltransferase [Deferrisoma camini]|uniref:nicotinate-nucleotide--dimethylbenzimidazole phosphoribosyltransferase n=1 Tax=Deferrisoma camini TaxID=1035120 RepID=UPI00046CC063|nr:nicotinate-nucleotide--dimethylbenzimidazole phosphoribosyltransferase [Deferrisoma camini]